jgi:hypothetical protein
MSTPLRESVGVRRSHLEGSLLHEDFPRRRPDVETHVLPDGTCLLFDPLALQGHALSAVGALVWDYCDGTVSRAEITNEVGSLLPEVPQLRDEVLQLLDRFASDGLLVAVGGESRRP